MSLINRLIDNWWINNFYAVIDQLNLIDDLLYWLNNKVTKEGYKLNWLKFSELIHN